MKIKQSKYTRIFNILSYTIITITAIICVLPFLIIISGSLSDNGIVVQEGYSLFPKQFTLDAYKYIFESPKGTVQAYGVTLYCTLVGTAMGLAVISLTGYVLSRKEFKYRNIISFLIYFTTIMGGGLVPWYIMYVSVLDLKGTLTALWLPGIASPFLIILMRTFMMGGVPDELVDAAKIDGAGYFTIFAKVVLPISKSGLATIGLFLALGYWNDWYRSSLFSDNSSTWSLQYYLYELINKAQAALDVSGSANVVINPPTQTVKLAMTVVATGPILLVYPFVQKYFVEGITVGAVKG